MASFLNFKSIYRIIFLLLVLELGKIHVAANLLAQGSWGVSFKGIGTFSSPRVTDLNGDGTGDVIIGAGRE
jgi:hypothetical protein